MQTTRAGDFEAYKSLEVEYAYFVGHKYGVGVNTGTAALHLALVALGIGKGDEVIIPDFTMAACAFAVAYTGATVVTVDCKDDLTIDENKIEEKITERTKAIMPVHIYGRLCNMEWINHLAELHGLYVIEDTAEAHGAEVGNATITCFSFYKNKIIHGEEGGMVTTNDERLYKEMQDLKNMAFGEDHDYFHNRIGFNYRMPETSAKLILESFDKREKNIAKRRKIEGWLNDLFPMAWKMPERDAVWVYDFAPPAMYRNLGRKLKNNRFRQFFKPISTFPMFKQKTGPKAKYWSSKGYYLRISPDDSYEELKEICRRILS